jgi:hypothetical protein
MALFNIKFRATTKGAKRSALPIIANDFNKIFRRNKRQLESYAKLTIELALRESETYHSLLGDDLTGLRAELGLADPLGEVGPIIDKWVSSIHVRLTDVRVAGNRLAGGIELYGIDSTFLDVLAMPTASFVSERAAKQGIDPSVIEWLAWLLLAGSDSLVFGFFVDTDLKSTDNSRTGLAVMRDERSVRLKGLEWKVPEQFQGTVSNNWVTRAIIGGEGETGVIDEIREYILQTILSQLGTVQRLGE